MLVEVARRLDRVAGKGDLLARLGSDEFGWSIGGLADPAVARDRAGALTAALALPVALDAGVVTIGVQVGIALAPAHAVDGDALVRCADLAMYDAKRRAVGARVFSRELDDDARRRLQIRTRLHAAIEHGAVEVWLQPQRAARDGRLVGAEAPVRWFDPVLGGVSPAEFVPIAEASGAIRPLTDHALRVVVETARSLAERGVRLDLSINLSPRLLDDPDLLERLLGAMPGRDPAALRLTLEVTEGALLESPERATAALHALRAAGFEIALDDFGSGYSSLGWLARLPADELKLDRSLLPDRVPGEGPSARAADVVAGMVAIAHRLGRRVVAEGVEDAARAAWLAAIGCDRVQGWHGGKPMPRDRFLALVAAETVAAAPLEVRDASRPVDRADLGTT